MKRYDIIEFGAIGDGVQKATGALQRAIDCCFDNGGGTVLVSGGTYCTGTIYLKSNITLEIDVSAVLLASPDICDYGKDTHYNRYRNEPELDRCLIYAQDARNIALTGYGKIDGNAEAFPNEDSIYRPMMIRMLRCEQVHIENLSLYNSAAWTTAFLDSSYLWIRGVDIRNEKKYNGDGLDFDGCSHVWVSDCSLKGTDDNLCLQSSGRTAENIHITNCSFSSICAGIRIGLKSIGSIQDVVISNCTMKNIWREGIKIECSEGGTISDIMIQNIMMRNVRRPLFMILNNRYEPDGLGSSLELDHMPPIGQMERITVSGLCAVDDEIMKEKQYRFQDDVMGEPRFNGIRIDANRNHPIREVTLRDVRYCCIGTVKRNDIPERYPEVLDWTEEATMSDRQFKSSENYYPDWSRTVFADIRGVKGLVFDRVTFSKKYPDERPGWLIEHCSDRKGEPEEIGEIR